MPVIKANGTNLEYIEMGRGDPVVFVHGSLGDLRSWSLRMEPFSKLYRAILLRTHDLLLKKSANNNIDPVAVTIHGKPRSSKVVEKSG